MKRVEGVLDFHLLSILPFFEFLLDLVDGQVRLSEGEMKSCKHLGGFHHFFRLIPSFLRREKESIVASMNRILETIKAEDLFAINTKVIETF